MVPRDPAVQDGEFFRFRMTALQAGRAAVGVP